MDAVPPPTPEPQVIDEDLPCPKCQYSVRGLTVPRCPECGFAFMWTDLPALRLRGRSDGRWVAMAVLVLFGLFALFMLAPSTLVGKALAVLAVVALVSAVVAFVAFAASGFQSVVEIAVASACIGLPSWPRIRAWWEGVLIGYGACSLTLFIGGSAFIPMERYGSWTDTRRLWPWLLLTFLESCLIQWWVVRRRLRQWDEPVTPWRLLLGCLAAKFAVAVPWLYLAQYIQPL